MYFVVIVAVWIAFAILAIAGRCFTEWFLARFLYVGPRHSKQILALLISLIASLLLYCIF